MISQKKKNGMISQIMELLYEQEWHVRKFHYKSLLNLVCLLSRI